VLFSNIARTHELGRIRDWVVIYYQTDNQPEGQCTVVTETPGPIEGQLVVRAREVEYRAHYAHQSPPSERPQSSTLIPTLPANDPVLLCEITGSEDLGVSRCKESYNETAHPASKRDIENERLPPAEILDDASKGKRCVPACRLTERDLRTFVSLRGHPES